jgi:hypothetical protein
MQHACILCWACTYLIACTLCIYARMLVVDRPSTGGQFYSSFWLWQTGWHNKLLHFTVGPISATWMPCRVQVNWCCCNLPNAFHANHTSEQQRIKLIRRISWPQTEPLRVLYWQMVQTHMSASSVVDGRSSDGHMVGTLDGYNQVDALNFHIPLISIGRPHIMLFSSE